MDVNARHDHRKHGHPPISPRMPNDQNSGVIRLDHVARRKLEALMSMVSLAVFSTNWFANLEYIVWEALNKADPHPFSAKQIIELQGLIGASGGWIRVHRGERVFVPLDEWRRHYEQYQKWLPRSRRARGWGLFGR
jgi:hypothetical protein